MPQTQNEDEAEIGVVVLRINLEDVQLRREILAILLARPKFAQINLPNPTTALRIKPFTTRIGVLRVILITVDTRVTALLAVTPTPTVCFKSVKDPLGKALC